MYFLEQIMVLLGFVGISLFNYGALNYYLTQTSEHYRKLEYHRKCYMVKNLSKSLMLFMMLASAPRFLFQTMIYQNYDNWWITFYGNVYVSTDLTALLVVPKLPMTTKIHHICVLLFGMVNILVDYEQEGFHLVLVPLTVFSCFPYIVNFYLAYRWSPLPFKNSVLIQLCFWTYGLSIMANLFFQHYYVFYLFEPQYINYIYLCLYYLAILRDDLKLMQYLFYKGFTSRKMKYKEINNDAESSESETKCGGKEFDENILY
jgi:hypothetical protein